MSAYMCTDIHLSALASYARTHNLHSAAKYSALDIVQVLHHANELSVNHRYPHKASNLGEFVQFIPAGARLAREATPLEMYVSAHCYAYQSSEHPGWRQSTGFHIVEAIKAHTIALNGGIVFSTDSQDSVNWGAPGTVCR